VSFADVRFTWPGAQAFTLSVPEFKLGPRERLLLLGPSGSGKSTFLSLLSGIVVAQDGEVEVMGTRLGKLGGASRDRFRVEHMGIIFQMFNLLPYGSVLDNVLLPLSFSPGRRARASAPTGNPEDEARRLLAALGLEPSLADGASAASLSTGQQQRVAAARALIGRPEIIVADEPTSSLDRDRQTQFLDLLSAELNAAGASLVMVSHDESLAPRFDRAARLADISLASREEPA
jgi:putative ABC transport system ATP-binding protein